VNECRTARERDVKHDNTIYTNQAHKWWWWWKRHNPHYHSSVPCNCSLSVYDISCISYGD